jgi:hypothetical protein
LAGGWAIGGIVALEAKAEPSPPESVEIDELEAMVRWVVRLIVTGHRLPLGALSPDSPDGPARCRRRAPIFSASSISYAKPGSRILTDATGERRILPFRQRFRASRACRPNPNGESGLRDPNRAAGASIATGL